MEKKDIIGAVNAQIPGLDLPEDTNLTVDQLNAVKSALKSKEDEIAACKATADEAVESAKQAMEAMAKVEAAAAEAVTAAGGAPVVTISGKKYQVLGGIRHKGQLISRDKLAKDKDLLAKLVEVGSGIVQPVKA